MHLKGSLTKVRVDGLFLECFVRGVLNPDLVDHISLVLKEVVRYKIRGGFLRLQIRLEDHHLGNLVSMLLVQLRSPCVVRVVDITRANA